MPEIEEAIAEWRRQMLGAGIKTPVPLEELEIHLREEIEQRMKSGSNAQQAFEMAVQRLGQAGALKNEFTKVGGTKESRLKKLIVTIAVANVVFGAFGILGGFFDLVGAYDFLWQGVRFSARETLFLKINWSLAFYDAVCGFIAIVAAMGLLKRRRFGVRLTLVYAAMTIFAVLAHASLRIWQMSFIRGDGFVDSLCLLYLTTLLCLCRRSGLKEQYV